MALTYKADEDGNIYADISNVVKGNVTEVGYTNQTITLAMSCGLIQDDELKKALCASRALRKTVTFTSDLRGKLDIGTFEMLNGYTPDGTKAYTTVNIYVDGAAPPDNFEVWSECKNNLPPSGSGTGWLSSQNIIFSNFKSATMYIVGVCSGELDNITAIGLLPILRIVLQNGSILYQQFSLVPMPGRGYLGTGRKGQMEGLEISPELEKLVDKTDDDTPDTTPDGGWGGGQNPTDNIDIPPLPNVNLNVTGSSLYALNESQMSQFSTWLWSSDWQDNIKRIHNTPMENIINVAIADCNVGGNDSTVIVGNINSNVPGQIAGRWQEVSCGTIDVREYYGTFADYEPYVTFTLYLPKVGYVQIPADVIVNNKITVTYHIELSSGEGICYVLITNARNDVTYIYNTYSCKCTSDIVLSASDRSGQAIAFASSATSLIASTIAGNPVGMATSALSGAMSVATAKNPTVTRGQMGNFSALMSHKKPFLLIQATNLTKPKNYRENKGHAIYFTTELLSNLSGYVQTMDFHADFNCPADVGAEIERLLNEGVFIDE